MLLSLERAARPNSCLSCHWIGIGFIWKVRQGSKLSLHNSKDKTKSCLPLTSLDFNLFHLKSVVFLHNAIVTITIKNGLISDGGGVQTASLAAFLFVAWGVRRRFTGSSTGRMVCRNQRKKGAVSATTDLIIVVIYICVVCLFNEQRALYSFRCRPRLKLHR